MFLDLALLSGLSEDITKLDYSQRGARSDDSRCAWEAKEQAESQALEKSLDDDIAKAISEEEQPQAPSDSVSPDIVGSISVEHDTASTDITFSPSVDDSISGTPGSECSTSAESGIAGDEMERPQIEGRLGVGEGLISPEETHQVVASVTGKIVRDIVENLPANLESDDIQEVHNLDIEKPPSQSDSSAPTHRSVLQTRLSRPTSVEPTELHERSKLNTVSHTGDNDKENLSSKAIPQSLRTQLKLENPEQQFANELRNIQVAHLQVSALKSLSVLLACSSYAELLLVPKSAAKPTPPQSKQKDVQGSSSDGTKILKPAGKTPPEEETKKIGGSNKEEDLRSTMRIIMRQMVKRAVLPSPIKRVVSIQELERAHGMLVKLAAQAPYNGNKDGTSKLGKCTQQVM